MKSIFTVTTSNDGLMNAGFTNIKAMYDFLLMELKIGKSYISISGKDVLLTYSNLVKTIRVSQSENRFFVAHIYSDVSDTITINELGLISK